MTHLPIRTRLRGPVGRGSRRSAGPGLFAALLLAGVLAWAQDPGQAAPDAPKPTGETTEKSPAVPTPTLAAETEVLADTMTYDEKTGEYKGLGNVRVTNGEVVMTADALKAEIEPATGGIKRVTLSKNATIVHGESTVKANLAVYDMAAELVTLTHEPQVFHGPHSLRDATEVRYSLKDDVITASGDPIKLALLRAAGDGGLIPNIGEGRGTPVAPAPGGSKVTIAAKSLVMLTGDRKVEFSQDVLVVDNDLNLRADKLVITYNEANQLQHISAQGNVVVTRGQETATAQVADYFVDQGYMTMTGNPVLRPQPGVRLVDGEAIEYRRNEGKLKATGRPRIEYRKE